MSAEQNKALVRRFFEAQEDVNSRKANLEALDEILAPDFVSHAKLLPGQQPGREGYKRAIAEVLATGSNTRYLIEDQVAEEDKVVSRLIVHAIHDRRELMGVAPSGREVAYKGIAIHRISEGRITEEWALGTTGPKLMRQRLEQELEQEMRERERIEQELLVARRIQQASLPKEVPTLEGWQISPYFRPAREVGGDFYEFFELDDGRVGFAVGDATGKGVSAAFVMTGTCAFLGGVATASGAS